IDPGSVQATDLTLGGIAGASVTGVTVLPGNLTARFTLNVAAEGTLTASIAGSAITDAFGNPGTNFSASYVVDLGTVPYPLPVSPKAPAGSLVYDPGVSGTIGFVGDVDSFTIDLDAGQTLTALVTPTVGTLQPTFEVRNPANAVVGSATAAAAGQS